MFEFLTRWFSGWTPAPVVPIPVVPPPDPVPAALPGLPEPGDYAALYASAALSQGAGADIQAAAIIAHRATYAAAGLPLGVPWWWVGCIHWMESSGDFKTHLHNGDPLTARTVHVPAGRPAFGSPTFTWPVSAADALSMRGLVGVVWTIAEALHRAEAYNGMGYAKRGIRTPYLWSATNMEQAGRYIADGEWDGSAVSAQIGVAAMMLALQRANIELGAI